MKKSATDHRFSWISAWAFAFGNAAGWGVFVMPGMSFLPKAGPIGTVLGIAIGGVIMSVIAWNYNYMTRRHPGPGGALGFAVQAFGVDHGFLCSWFLCLTYLAVLWANATALTIVVRCIFGDAFRFGFSYSFAGYDIYLGDILLSNAAIVLAAVASWRRRVAGGAQSLFALMFAAGAAICFTAALFGPDVHFSAANPAFAPSGDSPATQVLKIVALAPWLFVGFESISHLSGEFRFSLGRAFSAMVVAIASAVFAYVVFAVIPALAPADGFTGWTDHLARLDGLDGALSLPTFASACKVLGRAGTAVVGMTMLGAIFTSLVGNITVASRLVGAMSDDGILPVKLGAKGSDGTPVGAILFIAALSLAMPFLGRTAIGFIVDVATIGAAIAYAYTSAAVVRTAKAEGNRMARAVGFCGLALSVAVCALFILPNYFAGSMMATESYFLLVLWSLFGFIFYRAVFGLDKERRFGRSTVVWMVIIVMIFFLSHMWMRQATYDTTRRSFSAIDEVHERIRANPPGSGSDGGWHANLARQLESANGSLVHVGLVQAGLMAVTLWIMFSLYAILRRRERRLELEKTRAKSYFFSTVSHDIRTPLNAIIGFSEMLKTGFKTEAERNQALDAIMSSGKTLLGLINDVLDLSKLESGRMEIKLEPTDCPRLLNGVMDVFRVSAGKPEVELACKIGEMPTLMLDPQRLRQIAFNLVGNAVKFTARGQVTLRAAYERKEGAETGVFKLLVADTGCGISEEDLKLIGSAYVQVGAKLSRNGGTGLGLAICRQLASAMGGEMKVESALGRGSVFSVEIPDVRTAVAAEADTPAGETPAAPAPVPDRPLHRILIVDDSKVNLMVLKAHLKKQGCYDAVSAMDGQQALAALEASGDAPFDLVLTDMWMPNMDGEGLIKAIRANPALASLRVIVVTADVELRDKAIAMGFDGILLKPVTTEMLAATMSGMDGSKDESRPS